MLELVTESAITFLFCSIRHVHEYLAGEFVCLIRVFMCAHGYICTCVPEGQKLILDLFLSYCHSLTLELFDSARLAGQ